MSTEKPTSKGQGSGPARNEEITSGMGLARKTSVVGGMTLISRILGLLRDVVFARYFGAQLVMDAFLVANRIPNMLRRFFAEGAFSAGFVPVMARYRESHDHGEAREFIDAVSGTFGIILFLVTLVGVIAAPLLVLVVAPGFVGDGGDLDLAALMLRFTFPYLFFVSLTAFAGGILNTYGRFGIPALTPVILNIVLIAAAVWLSPHLEQPIMALAYAVFIAGVCQLLFQIPFLAKIHALPRPKWAPQHAGVKRAFKLMVPAIFGSSAAQINVLLGGIIASMLPIGSISYLYYSDRLMEFPLGIFSIALGTVTLPYLSRLWAKEDKTTFSQTLDWSLRLALLIAIPAAIGLFALAEPLVTVLFFGGEFDLHAVQMTALALKAYAVGLIGFSLVKIFAPAYFAREDTRTPVRMAVIALCVNLVLSVGIALVMTRNNVAGPHAGLAAATSVAAILNAALLYRGLIRDRILRHSNGWLPLLLRLAFANAVMIAAVYLLDRPLEWWIAASFSARVAWITVTIIACAAAYFATLVMTGTRLSQFRLRAK
ncbi:MAG: murein biosynthesis integral membrane protein MurJ [Gammaproteobacteria bacterium]|nr:murein biosynthesis integral membrane protein MurJ [Gammaproteobacteria bacterium]MDH5584915.1 murein biosynthesis integral membrane protein MurJ [Gammaproteobacteria bacterium]